MNVVNFALLLVILVHESYNVAGQNRCGNLTIDYIHTGQTVSAKISFKPSKTLEMYNWIHTFPGASPDFDFDQNSRQNSGKYHLSENPISILIKDINPSDDGLYYIECMLAQGIVSVSENGMNIHKPYITATVAVPLPEEIDTAIIRDKRDTDDYYYNYGESETTEMPTGHGTSDFLYGDYGMPQTTENVPMYGDYGMPQTTENVPMYGDYGMPQTTENVQMYGDYDLWYEDYNPEFEDYAPSSEDNAPQTTPPERRSTETAEYISTESIVHVPSENITTIKPEATVGNDNVMSENDDVTSKSADVTSESNNVTSGSADYMSGSDDVTLGGEDEGMGNEIRCVILFSTMLVIILVVIGLAVFFYKKKFGVEVADKDNLRGQRSKFSNDTRTFHNGVYSTGLNFNTNGTMALQSFAIPKINEGQNGYDRFNHQQSRVKENTDTNTNTLDSVKCVDIERPKLDDYENWDVNF